MPNNSRQQRIDLLKDECIKLFDSGLSIRKISIKLSIGYSTLKARFREWKVSNRDRRYISTKSKSINDAKENIIQLYSEGKSIKELAELYDINSSALGRRLKEWGIQARKSQTYKSIKSQIIENNKDKIIHLYMQENKALREIGEIFKLDAENLGKRIRKWGIHKNPNHSRITCGGKNNKARAYDSIVPDIIKYYEEHKEECTYTSLGKKFNMSETTVRKRLKALGIILKGKPKATPILDKFLRNKERILKLFTEENWTLDNIAKEVGICKSTLYKKLKSLGIYKTKKQYKELQNKVHISNKFYLPEEELIELYVVQKLSARKIARKCNVSKATIITLLKEHGLLQSCKDRYGVPYYCMSPECSFKSNKNSQVNKSWVDKLMKLGYKAVSEFNINNRAYDIQLDKTRILIEINPTFTHNSTKILGNKKGKDSLYHQQKSILATENEYHCIHIWDWDNKQKIIDIFRPKKKVSIKDILLQEVSKEEVTTFNDLYNLSSAKEEVDVSLGLYYHDTLISLITFKKLKDNLWKVLNYTTHPKFRVLEGINLLFSYFIKQFNPEQVVIFLDYSKFSGKLFKNVGFELQEITKPQVHLVKGKEHIIPKNNNYKHLLEEGFVEVYDCGYLHMVWNREKNI